MAKKTAAKTAAGKKGSAKQFTVTTQPLKKPAKKPTAKKLAPKKNVIPATGDDFSPDRFFKAKIRVVGIGGGGGSIVSDIGRTLGKASFVVADTDARIFRRKSGVKHFLFGRQLTGGLGTGLNTDLARQAAEAEKDKIAGLFAGQDIIIFIASLGGGLGSGATRVFAEAAKESGGITFGIFTMPFKFEGKNKFKIASKAQRELQQLLNVSITIPNERIFKIIQPDTAITDAFSMVNRSLVGSLESLVDLIYSPGVINIDFADLKAILKGSGSMAFLNTAEASGKDRADKVIKDILHNPLYPQQFTPEKVLFNIAGGGQLSMFEVDKISKAIAQQNPSAKIIFGISRNPKLKNKIKTTLLMTGGAKAPAPAPAKPAPKSAPAAPQKKEAGKKSPRPVKATHPARKRKRAPLPVSKPNPRSSGPAAMPVPPPLLNPVNPVLAGSAAGQGFRQLRVEQVLDADKKIIRRTALQAKHDEESDADKKTRQEEEWDIPAFLRFKK